MENSATDYTIIVNTVIRDNRLSASDLGLLIYLLHLPETWKIQPVQLADRFDCNRQTIYTQLNRLKDLEYIEYQQSRKGGSFSGGEWKVSKSPYTKKPDTVNRTLLSTNNLPNTEDTKSLRLIGATSCMTIAQSACCRMLGCAGLITRSSKTRTDQSHNARSTCRRIG